MYICRNFTTAELFAPEIRAVLSDVAMWQLLPDTVKRNLDRLRDVYGDAIWINGSGLKYCGVRPVDCVVGAEMSRHKLVQVDVFAFDLHCRNLDRLTAKIHQHHQELGIVRLEDPKYTQSWRHVEFHATEKPLELNIFIP